MLERMRRTWFLAALFLLVVGCGGNDGNMIGPSNQPEIRNQPNSFEFQASHLSSTTQTLSYTWTHTGPVADVDQSGQITSGQARLVIRDAGGTTVYEADLRATGSFDTASGVPGPWQIEVRLQAVSGTLNFRVQSQS